MASEYRRRHTACGGVESTALILLMCVTTAGSTTGGEGVDRGGASADTGAELLAFARERAALCAGAHCRDAVVVGFANMGYVPAEIYAVNGTDLLACLSVSREVRARQRARHLILPFSLLPISHECCARVLRGGRYSKFALNWVLSMRYISLDNFVLVALDERAHAYFSRLGVPSFYVASLGAVHYKK